ncbi:MAG: hypothetical protein AB7E26_01875 [Chryseobacterium sp.]
MIEKYYWQKKLSKITASLKNRKHFKKDSSNIIGELEFNIASGFYIIRKLMEHNKLTNRFISTNVKGVKYPFLHHKKLTPFNAHRWPEFYDLQNKQTAKFDIQFLCNLFIHSFYFVPSAIFVEEHINTQFENTLEINDNEYYDLCKIHKRTYNKILFNSDDKKTEFLYEIDVDKIINIFEEVSLIDITKASIKYNPKTDRYNFSLENPTD